MRKSNNYFKFLEYVTYGKDHDNTIDKGNGVLACKSYASISDIEDRYKTTFGLENEWLTFKNVLINEDTLYVYYFDGKNSKLVAGYLLDNFKTQKELKESITIACTEFAHDLLLEKSEETEETVKEVCEQTWNRYEAIINPEWHHVSLETVRNIDFDYLDEKLQRYLTVYRELQETLARLRKCKTIDSYDKCCIRFKRSKNAMRARGEISNEMRHYIEVKLSMQNVESGVWSSDCEDATGFHKSRRYNKRRIDL